MNIYHEEKLNDDERGGAEGGEMEVSQEDVEWPGARREHQGKDKSQSADPG